MLFCVQNDFRSSGIVEINGRLRMDQFLVFHTKDDLFSMVRTANSSSSTYSTLITRSKAVARFNEEQIKDVIVGRHWLQISNPWLVPTNTYIFYLLLIKSSNCFRLSDQSGVDATRRISWNWWFLPLKINHLWYEKSRIAARHWTQVLLSTSPF